MRSPVLPLCVVLPLLVGCGGGPRVDLQIETGAAVFAESGARRALPPKQDQLWQDVVNGDYWEYSKAARTIVEDMGTDAFPLLVSRLDDRRETCGSRVPIAQALIESVLKECELEQLHALAQHEAAVVRYEVARELGERGETASVQALARLEMTDDHPSVRAAARKARKACAKDLVTARK